MQKESQFTSHVHFFCKLKKKIQLYNTYYYAQTTCISLASGTDNHKMYSLTFGSRKTELLPNDPVTNNVMWNYF